MYTPFTMFQSVGNSWRHEAPQSAVSSRARNRVELIIGCPARKSLHSLMAVIKQQYQPLHNVIVLLLEQILHYLIPPQIHRRLLCHKKYITLQGFSIAHTICFLAWKPEKSIYCIHNLAIFLNKYQYIIFWLQLSVQHTYMYILLDMQDKCFLYLALWKGSRDAFAHA